MADPKDETIQLDDEATIDIDVTDNPALAAVEPPEAEEEGVVAATPEPEPKPAPAPKKADEAAAASVALQEAVNKANADRQAAEATAAAERKRSEEAQRALSARDAELKAAREQAAQREMDIITSGVETASRDLESLEAEFVRAQEAGDFKLAASVQTKVAKVAATLGRLEEAKDQLENRKSEPEPVAPAPSAASPFEAYVGNFAPAAQAWLRAHPECVPAEVGGNSQANAKMMSGHYAALASGFAPNSEEYFRVIEEYTGHRKTEEPAPVSNPPPKPAPAAARPKAQPSAPVSRDPPAASGQPNISRNTRSVTLTPEQQEAARISFPSLTPREAFAQYARNLIELQAEGKIGRTTH